MGKPTEQQLETALAVAVDMREREHDPHFVAKSLLNCHYRLEHLEQLLKLTEQYLHAGQNEQQHAHLLVAIEKYHQLDDHTAAVDRLKFGLD
ncbi:hypothetical protein [Motiliproteus sp.]|uniref:hypothetical protein n=1 Tax=Motiliproteus sp. TaxID=1898955 RepID=UPI003BAB0285